MWKNDKYFRAIADSIRSTKLVSFDIFDTILFRTVSTPDRIFLYTGMRMCELYPEYELPPEVFAGMRTEAEGMARKKAWELFGHEDVTLAEIYAEFCLGDQFRMRASECELAVEARHLYLNHNVEGFMRYCREQGNKLALVSDTYFNNQQIKELLIICGFDISLIDFFIISCEFRALKHNGKLFNRLLDSATDIKPEHVLHIGDNRIADIDGASLAGIRGEYYGVIPRAVLHPMSVETSAFNTVEPLLSLRKYACSLIPSEYQTAEEVTLFETGASVFGSVYATFAEWIIEQCIKEKINVVLAFMREGELLAQVINSAAHNRGIDLTVKTVFISRRTTEIVAFVTIDNSVVDEYIHRDRLSLRDLFTIFYLDIEKTIFSADAALTIQQCREKGTFDALRDYFKQTSTLDEINKRVTEQRELLIKYIGSLTENKDAVTVDIGFRGTMQDCLTGINANGTARLLHLLMMGIPYNNRFLLKGVEIRGWLGYGNENREAVQMVYSRIQMPEAVTNADIGTTLLYKYNDGIITAVLEGVFIDEDNKRRKKIIWQGIQCYQECWFNLLKKKPYLIGNAINDKQGFFGILTRLLLMPSQEEASVLGNMYYDESILNSEKSMVIKPADYKLYDLIGNPSDFIDKCLSQTLQEPVYWPEGVVAIKNPSYFIDKCIKSSGITAFRKAQEFLTHTELKGKRVAIYGAGAIGRELVGVLSALGIVIDCMVDSNPSLNGRYFSGTKVISPEDSVGIADVYIVTPLRFEKEIIELLCHLTSELSEKPEIIIYR